MYMFIDMTVVLVMTADGNNGLRSYLTLPFAWYQTSDLELNGVMTPEARYICGS